MSKSRLSSLKLELNSSGGSSNFSGAQDEGRVEFVEEIEVEDVFGELLDDAGGVDGLLANVLLAHCKTACTRFVAPDIVLAAVGFEEMEFE